MTKASKAPKRKNERDASVPQEQDEDVIDRLVRRYLPVLRQLYGDCQYLLTVIGPDSNNEGGIDENEQRLGQFVGIVEVVINKITLVESQDKLTVNFRKMEALEQSIVGTILPVRDRLHEKWKENEKKRARHTKLAEDDKSGEQTQVQTETTSLGENTSKRQRRSVPSAVGSATSDVVSTATSSSTSMAADALHTTNAGSGLVTVKVEVAPAHVSSPELVGEGSVTVIGACSRAPVGYRPEAKPVSSHGMDVVSQGMLTVDAAGGITREGGMHFFPQEGQGQEDEVQEPPRTVLSHGGQPPPQFGNEALGDGFAMNLDMCDEVSIFDGPVSGGYGTRHNRGPQPDTWHKPADRAVHTVSSESAAALPGYTAHSTSAYEVPSGLAGPQARVARTADYCCSICLGTYQMLVQDNPWWAVYQHECPHCGIVQVPRIDITAPSNAVTRDPNAAPLYAEEEGSPMHLGEMQSPGELRDSVTDRISFDSNDSAFNRFLDGQDEPEEGVRPSIPQTQFVPQVMSQSAPIPPPAPMPPLPPVAVHPPAAAVYPAGGGAGTSLGMNATTAVPGFSPEDQAKLLVLINHARTCTGVHSGPAHEEVCRNAKRLILHASACAGIGPSGGTCTFPWCLPCRTMLSHLAQCYQPSYCQICNPWSMTRPYELGRRFPP